MAIIRILPSTSIFTGTGTDTFNGTSNVFSGTINVDTIHQNVSMQLGIDHTFGNVVIGGSAANIQLTSLTNFNKGAAASGAFAFDLSNSTGTFKTPTGASTFSGSSNSFTNSINPSVDDTVSVGTFALRWSSVHVGHGSVVVHNDNTNTDFMSLDYNGALARLRTTSANMSVIPAGNLSVDAGPAHVLNVGTNNTNQINMGQTGIPLAIYADLNAGVHNISLAADTAFSLATGGNAGISITSARSSYYHATNGTISIATTAGGLVSLDGYAGVTIGDQNNVIFSTDGYGNLTLGSGTTTTNVIGALSPQSDSSYDLGTSSKRWRDGYFSSYLVMSGTIAKYNNENTASVGIAYIDGYGQDVAWSGSATTIASFTPAISGLYRISIVVSTTTGDTVTVQITYTDAVNNTAQTLSPISAAVLGANSTTSSSTLIRANTINTIVVKISSATQTSTKASAIIERMS